MQKGCWLDITGTCPGEASRATPICFPCWDAATDRIREDVKERYNELSSDLKFCIQPGCWAPVQKKNQDEGVCTHYLKSGGCKNVFWEGTEVPLHHALPRHPPARDVKEERVAESPRRKRRHASAPRGSSATPARRRSRSRNPPAGGRFRTISDDMAEILADVRSCKNRLAIIDDQLVKLITRHVSS